VGIIGRLGKIFGVGLNFFGCKMTFGAKRGNVILKEPLALSDRRESNGGAYAE